MAAPLTPPVTQHRAGGGPRVAFAGWLHQPSPLVAEYLFRGGNFLAGMVWSQKSHFLCPHPYVHCYASCTDLFVSNILFLLCQGPWPKSYMIDRFPIIYVYPYLNSLVYSLNVDDPRISTSPSTGRIFFSPPSFRTTPEYECSK